MGCGSSNSLESSDFKNSENNQKTHFLKIVYNYNLLYRKSNKFITEVKNIWNQKELTNYVKEFKAEDIKLTPAELSDCIYYARYKSILECANATNSEDLLADRIREGDKEKRTLLGKTFLEYTGKSFAATFVPLNKLPEGSKIAFMLMKYDNDYAQSNSFVIIFPDEVTEDVETMKCFGSFIKLHPNLKNLVVGDDIEKNTNYDNFAYIFEAISLSKTLKNFCYLKFRSNDIKFKPDIVTKIANSFIRCRLDSFGLYNFSFGREANKIIYSALAKNPSLKLIGIQDPETKSSQNVDELVKYFVKTPSLRILAIGAILDNYEYSQKSADLILKSNTKVEAVIIGWGNIK
jgi:hypothetical protein